MQFQVIVQYCTLLVYGLCIVPTNSIRMISIGSLIDESAIWEKNCTATGKLHKVKPSAFELF